MGNAYSQSKVDDLFFRIRRAKELNQLSEEAKLILWGEILEANIVPKYIDLLTAEMNLDKEKYWKAFEVATFGEEQ